MTAIQLKADALAYTKHGAFGIIKPLLPEQTKPICSITNEKSFRGEFTSMRNILSALLAFAAFAAFATFVNSAIQGASATLSVSFASSDNSAMELFAKNCASCHGRDGRAKTFKAKFNHATDLTDSEWQGNVSDERIFNSIMNGKGKKMPAFGTKLSEQKIDSLVAYVRGLKR